MLIGEHKPQRQPNTKQLKAFLIARFLQKFPKQIPSRIVPNLKPMLAKKYFDSRSKQILFNIELVEVITINVVEPSTSIMSTSMSKK